MRRFRLVFAAIALALFVPVALLVERAVRSVALEREVRHATVAERVFDEMERALSELLAREEARPFDGYGADVETPGPPFVAGYFQVDPDGSVHEGRGSRLGEREAEPRRQRLMAAVDALEGKTQAAGTVGQKDKQEAEQLPGTTVGVGEERQPAPPAAAQAPRADADAKADGPASAYEVLRSLNKGALQRAERSKKMAEVSPTSPPSPLADELDSADLSLPPMSGRVIDAHHLMLHRTVVRDARTWRQGVLIDVDRLEGWLLEQGLGNDGVADYAQVTFSHPFAPGPAGGPASALVYQHRFAEPFDDLRARLALRPLPGLGGGTYVYALSALLLVAGGLGLAALYRMVAVTVGFAERRSNFVAAVSHELKTPLTAIRMYAEMLRDGIVSSETKRDEYYRHITVESERLSRLINNVLEFSQLERGTRQLALVTGSVEPVVREVAELLRRHVEDAGFDLRVDVDGELPPVRFERDALMQVLFNLVDNAVKYAREAPTRCITLRGRRDRSEVRLAVRDHGPGVAAQHLGRIFEPFYRGESELTRRSKGTGLGLALVRDLVGRMGARVGGRNVPDGGFEVEIVFRAAA